MSKKIPTAAVVMLSGLLTALPMTSALAQSTAKDDLSRVEVSGQKVPQVTRFDVSAACPGVAASLAESLALTAHNVGRHAVVQVDFQLVGDQVVDVRSRGSLDYNMATRRAMYSVDCKVAGTQPQTFRFLVSFNSPEQLAANGQRVALLAPAEQAQR